MSRPVTVKSNPIITVRRAQSLQFVGVPKLLLEHAPELGITADDVLLYSVLRSRSDYSLRNGWKDESGRVYIIYTRQDAATYLGMSRTKIIDAFARLVGAGLIEEQEQFGNNNMMKTKRIFVKQWISPSEYAYKGAMTLNGIKNGELPYITPETVGDNPEKFYEIPRLLIEHPIYNGISLKGKFLYAIALDAIHKSIYFSEKIDTNGLPYCILDRENLMKLLQCSHRTITSLYKELTDIGLMIREHTGFDGNWRVYLRDFVPPEGDDVSEQLDPKASQNFNSVVAKNEQRSSSIYTAKSQILNSEVAVSEQRSRKIQTSESQNMDSEVANFAHSKSQKMDTSESLSQIQHSHPFYEVKSAVRSDVAGGSSSEATQHRVFSKFREDALCKVAIRYREDPIALERAKLLVNMAADYIEDDLSPDKPFARFGEDVIPAAQLRSAYEQISPMTLCVTVDKILDRWDNVKKLPEYVHKSLLTAAYDHEGEGYWMSKELHQ